MSWLAPTMFAPRISEIDHDALVATGIRGIIVDLDNTLVAYRQLEPDVADAAWIANAAEHGLKVIMVTNNRTPWAAQVAKNLGIACIPNARKPLPHGFRRGLRLLEMPKQAVIVIGDQIFTDVLGARMYGLRVILTDPLVAVDVWWQRPLRRIERMVLRRPPQKQTESSRDGIS